MFCSTIIPTIGRPTLGRAVRSALSQRAPDADAEVIVVNDSGRPLGEGPWASDRVRVVTASGRERSQARNTGAAAARGDYLHFLDDDDELLPGALAAWRRLQREHQDASWLVGAWQTVDRQDRFVAEFRPRLHGNIFPLLVAGEGLPLQASLLRARDFRAAGGFDARPEILGVEDRELGRRLALAGGVASCDALLARIRIGEAGSTTDWSAIGQRDRLGRERVLERPDALARLRAARPSSYWRGRLARAYAGSMLLNVAARRPRAALGRAVQGARLAHLHVVAPAFWRGLRMRPDGAE